MELKRGRIQSFASKHGKKGKELMEKYSHRERNRVLDCVHKFMNKLPERYPLTTFAVEKLNKQEMFEMPTTSRLSFVSIAFTGYVDVICK
jgi:putative transposase